MKFYSPKLLCENVSELVLGADVTDIHAPFFQTALDEVVLDPDVLASLVEDGVLGQCQGRLAVHLELDCLDLSTK
jgi:hypothetical protein